MHPFNIQNKNGNTPLHECFLHGTRFDIVEMISRRTDMRLKNKSGKTALHLAARHYNAMLEATELLLEQGADVNELDNQGSSVVHEAFKNPSVNLTVIEKLLKSGAYPDHRDKFGYPPLAYCVTSALQPYEKQITEEMLIKYSVLYNIQRNNLEGSGDAVVSFLFNKDTHKRKEWEKFRDGCITEILEFRKVDLELNYTLFQFLFDYSRKEVGCITLRNLKIILHQLQKNEYPIFRSKLISTIENNDFGELVEDLLPLAFTSFSSNGEVINVSLDCIRDLFEFLPKKDLINFILAFYKF